MKIGILTLPFNNNYGGYLQCYALMSILKELNHTPEVVYRKHNRRNVLWSVKQTIKNVIKYIFGRPVPTIFPNQEKELRYKGANIMPFVDKYIAPKTIPLYSDKEFYKVLKNRYDAIIVGSDQVWRPNYVPNIRNYFLSELNDNNVLRISYAASFGSDRPLYSDEEKYDCREAIEKFDAVSIREESGMDVIKSFGWKTQSPPKVVLDPTFLLDKDSYIDKLPKFPSKALGKVFCYVLDKSQNVKDAIVDICNKRNLEVFQIINTDIWSRQDYIMPSIEKWLMGIRDAELVVTDSFHGTVFSIIFNKDFIVFGNESRGKTRFISLLKIFRLEDRFVDMNNNASINCKPIDWIYVNKRINELREDSINFLEDSLSLSKR